LHSQCAVNKLSCSGASDLATGPIGIRARGLRGLHPWFGQSRHFSGKRQTLNFSDRSQQPKMKKSIY